MKEGKLNSVGGGSAAARRGKGDDVGERSHTLGPSRVATAAGKVKKKEYEGKVDEADGKK